MQRNRKKRDSKLWVITSYFNPAGYENRKLNYHRFRNQLNLPLVTAELSLNGHHDLTSSDAEILLSFQQGDVLWQKERLLNLAIKALPDHCEAVAWLDCDILFESDDWAAKAMVLLEHHTLLHAFNQIYDVPCGQESNWKSLSGHQMATPSVIQAWIEGDIDRKSLLDPDITSTAGRTRTTKSGKPIGTGGIGWVARRDFIESQSLYDGCIVGGGDGAMTHAVFGTAEQQVNMKCMNPSYAKHYLTWAHAFKEELKDKFGVIPSEAFHLWHGNLKNRNYWKRHQELAQFDYDPTSDISLARDGCWKWSSDKPEMHRHVREFFLSRKEDG